MDNYSRRASFYEMEYNTKEDFVFLREIIGKGNISILEIPSGSGRTLELYKTHNVHVVYVDKDITMIRKLEKRIQELPGNYNFECIVADIKDLNLKSKFNFIFILKEAFQLFSPTHAINILKRLKEHLLPNGKLYIDIFDVSKEPGSGIFQLPDYLNISKKYKRFMIDKTTYINRITYTNHIDNTLSINYEYFTYRNEALVDRFSSHINLYSWSQNEIESVFKKAGLQISNIYTDYNMSELDLNSPRKIFELKNE